MAFRLARLPATPDELYWYVRARYGLTIPRTQVCADHVSPFQAFSDAYFAVNTLDPESDIDFIALWHGSRGLSGKSVTLSILGLTLAELLGADVNLLGGSLSQSMNIHEHIGKALTHPNAPTYMLEEESNSKIVFSNGAHIRPLTASQKTVRGPHPPRILLDEIDEMELKILDAALGQPMPQPNYLGQQVTEYSVMCVAGDTLIRTPAGEVRIDGMQPGDLVLTRQGWRPVLRVLENGIRPVLDVLLSTGRVLTCTADHRIAVPGGWLTPEEMAVGQEVCGVGTDLIVGQEALSPAVGMPAAVEIPGLLAMGKSLAGLADPTATLRKPGVGGGEFVAVGAVGLECVAAGRGGAALPVDPRRDRFQMDRVAAGQADAAPGLDVIDFVSVGDRAHQAQVGPPVHRAAVDGAVHRAVAIGLGAVPYPAAGVVDGAAGSEPVFVVDIRARPLGHAGLPVYDLEVDEVHEFVAQGIVIHNCSTWQNPQGTFSEVKRRAEEKGWPTYTWCYRESANPVDGWLSEETIRKKRDGTSAVMWDTEYELNEPSADAHGFDRAWVERTFSLPFEPIRKAEAKDFEEYTFADPVREGIYVAGADWAKEKDYTVIAVGRVDVVPHTLVYYMKVNRRPYPTMIGYFNTALNRYKAFGKHDSTGLGNVIDGYVDLRADGFSMIGEKRNSMLSQWVNAVESGKWRVPKIKSAYIAHKFCKVGDLYSHKQEFHLPDEVCAMALMQAAAESLPPLVAPMQVGRGVAVTAAEEQFQHRPPRVGEVTSSRDEPTFTMLV